MAAPFDRTVRAEPGEAQLRTFERLARGMNTVL